MNEDNVFGLNGLDNFTKSYGVINEAYNLLIVTILRTEVCGVYGKGKSLIRSNI